MSRYLFPVFILGVVSTFGFCHLRDKSKSKTGGDDAQAGTKRSGISPESENGPKEVRRMKSRNRPNHPKPTIEETTELLRSTIIPVIDFHEDESVIERVTQINSLIKKAGIEPHRLRLLVPVNDRARQMRFRGGLKMRNVPAAVVLKYSIDNMVLRYRVCENGVVMLFADELEPPSYTPDKKEPRSDESDIFGNDLDALDEPDPFAPPAPAVNSGE